MAGASMKDIKLRIRSVENTMQITKAMQLVASSKLRGARMRMEASRPYFNMACETLSELANHRTLSDSVFLNAPKNEKVCYVVIAGDRGMAGSYNVNIFKLVEELRNGKPCTVLPIGRKANEHYRHAESVTVLDDSVEKADGITLTQCEVMAEKLIAGMRENRFDTVVLVHTEFKSILTQTAVSMMLLPLSVPEKAEQTSRQILCEPGIDAMLNAFLPQYVSGMLYAAVCDSVASEQAARRVAMDSATKNAGEMIENLSLKYNQARQSSITQELTEIVAGAEN